MGMTLSYDTLNTSVPAHSRIVFSFLRSKHPMHAESVWIILKLFGLNYVISSENYVEVIVDSSINTSSLQMVVAKNADWELFSP